MSNPSVDRQPTTSAFFPEETEKDPGRLLSMHSIYTQYFQESVWLLIQKFFCKLCRGAGNISLRQIRQALRNQQDEFWDGEQIHLGEVLLRSQVVDGELLYALLQKQGINIVFCRSCEQNYCRTFSLSAHSLVCPQCNATTEQVVAPKNELLIHAMRTSYCSPRSLPALTTDGNNFGFLDVTEHTNMNLSNLDHEVHSVLQSFLQWLEPPRMWGGKRSSNEGEINKRISKRLRTISLEAEDEIGEQQLNSADQFSPQLFLGFIYNLQEFFWLINQKVFSKICFYEQYVTPRQMDQALQEQQQQLQNGNQLPFGEILLQNAAIHSKHLHSGLYKLGTKILHCPKCNHHFLQLMESQAEFWCNKCYSPLSDSLLQEDLLRRALQTNFAAPIPIGEIIPVQKQFRFFTPRPHYAPDFSLSGKDIHNAISSYEASARIGPQRQHQKNAPGKIISNLTKRLSKRMRRIYSSENAVTAQSKLDIQSYTRLDKELIDKKITAEAIRHRGQEISSTAATSLAATEMWKNRPRPRSTQQSPWLLASILTISSCCLLGLFAFPLWINYKPQPDTNKPQRVVSNKEEPQSTPASAIEEPEVVEDNTSPAVPDKPQQEQRQPSPLQKFLAGEYTSKQLALMLTRLTQKKLLTASDIPFLQELYPRYALEQMLRFRVILALTSIGGDVARTWLEQLLLQPYHPEDRIYFIEALHQLGDQKAKNSILQVLQSEVEENTLCTIITALSKLFPQDKDVYYSLKRKFYEFDNERLQHHLLSAMDRMQVKERYLLFLAALRGDHYSVYIRKKALDALLDCSVEREQLIAELSTIGYVDNAFLREKIRSTIKYLQSN